MHSSETGPLGVAMVALPRLSLNTLQAVVFGWRPLHIRRWLMTGWQAGEASCLARPCLRHKQPEPPEYHRLPASSRRTFLSPRETLRLAETKNAYLDGYTFPANLASTS
jgi:hypothetical protein